MLTQHVQPLRPSPRDSGREQLGPASAVLSRVHETTGDAWGTPPDVEPQGSWCCTIPGSMIMNC
jgi:hypothetical protein